MYKRDLFLCVGIDVTVYLENEWRDLFLLAIFTQPLRKHCILLLKPPSEVSTTSLFRRVGIKKQNLTSNRRIILKQNLSKRRKKIIGYRNGQMSLATDCPKIDSIYQTLSKSYFLFFLILTLHQATLFLQVTHAFVLNRK